MEDSYAQAARTKHTDPARRADARTIAQLVHASDVGGVRRDWLRNRLRAWPEPRFKAALFYAYGRAWVDFIGWTYLVAPAPAITRLTASAAPAAAHTPAPPPQAPAPATPLAP